LAFQLAHEESCGERLARQTVAQQLGVPVTQFDDNSRESMPDALIHLPLGAVPLEIIGDHDAEHESLWAALESHGRRIETAPGQPSWYVTLRHHAHLKTVRKQLPGLLADLPLEPFRDHGPGGDTYFDDPLLRKIDEQLDNLNVDFLTPINEQFGYIRLSTAGWNSWDDPIDFLSWIPRVLSHHRDVAMKLIRHGGAERHAFIWVTSGSPWFVNSQLTDDDDDERSVPLQSPLLPDGITHLWIASVFAKRGVLYWSSDRGWQRTRVAARDSNGG
jgi:hypothetical protein